MRLNDSALLVKRGDLDDTVLSPVTQLLSPEQCSTYCSRVILDIDDSALTPVWCRSICVDQVCGL